MIFTENFQIPCLGSDDPGALALYMKCLAEKIEETYTAEQVALTQAIDHPTGLWVGQRDHTFLDNELELSVEFWNDPNIDNSPTAIVGVSDIGYNLPGNRIGVYLVGLYMNFTGAVVGGENFITLDARSLTYDSTTGNTFGGSVRTLKDSVLGTNLGGDPALIADTLVARYDDVVLTPRCDMTGGSTAAADIRMWATYLGPSELTEVI